MAPMTGYVYDVISSAGTDIVQEALDPLPGPSACHRGVRVRGRLPQTLLAAACALVLVCFLLVTSVVVAHTVTVFTEAVAGSLSDG